MWIMRTYTCIASALVFSCWAAALLAGQAVPPAFPGAQGYGAEAVGGRGGKVIEVTNLRDRGPGSFRAAITSEGRRIVVFHVGGVIELESRIDVAHPYVTVAGQTAPGGGITLKGTAASGGQMLRIRTHDVILRYLRIRSGAHGQPGRGQVNISLDPREADRGRYGDVYNVMLDHVSVSWSLDENIGIHRNVPEEKPDQWRDSPKIFNVSVQRCLIAEGLYPHSTGIQAGGERIARSGRQIYNGGQGVANLSIHRNLFANTSHRNPALGCASARAVNNVMYNWSSKCAETHDAIAVDWIGNCFKPGPLSDPRRLIVHNAFFKGSPQYRFAPPSIYMTNNLNVGDPKQADWDMYNIHYEDKPLPAEYRCDKPLAGAKYPVAVISPEKAFESVLADVGANARLSAEGEWVANWDAVDRRVLEDVRLGRGRGTLHEGNRVHYTHPDQMGGYPKIEPGDPYEDADHDGMADVWERKHNLDPHDVSDGNGDSDRDGYTNLEEFLNGTEPTMKEENQP